MIHIKRKAEPEILATNKDAWTRAYLDKRVKDAKARPSSKQYAHKDITERLESMSHHKCFYCECDKLDRDELDHRRLRRLRAFDKELIRILKLMQSENRAMTDAEREQLRGFTQPDAPFSLMFRCYLQRDGL